jgi:hypothetical protein
VAGVRARVAGLSPAVTTCALIILFVVACLLAAMSGQRAVLRSRRTGGAMYTAAELALIRCRRVPLQSGESGRSGTCKILDFFQATLLTRMSRKGNSHDDKRRKGDLTRERAHRG